MYTHSSGSKETHYCFMFGDSSTNDPRMQRFTRKKELLCGWCSQHLRQIEEKKGWKSEKICQKFSINPACFSLLLNKEKREQSHANHGNHKTSVSSVLTNPTPEQRTLQSKSGWCVLLRWHTQKFCAICVTFWTWTMQMNVDWSEARILNCSLPMHDRESSMQRACLLTSQIKQYFSI